MLNFSNFSNQKLKNWEIYISQVIPVLQFLLDCLKSSYYSFGDCVGLVSSNLSALSSDCAGAVRVVLRDYNGWVARGKIYFLIGVELSSLKSFRSCVRDVLKFREFVEIFAYCFCRAGRLNLDYKNGEISKIEFLKKKKMNFC